MKFDYHSMLELAKEHKYSSFTALQDLAFRTEDTYDYDKDLFVIGETSSGKTLIPLLIYSAAVKKAEALGEECPKMLFVVPYRALAAQKMEEMQRFFRDRDLRIVQSTGEFRQDDDLIQRAQVEIAVVITEKIFKYEAKESSFLSQYDYLVLDEVGLINDADRGVRLDFILAWAENQKMQKRHPRIIALGTPFFDWSAYINSYGFTPIKVEKRPVTLDEISVIHSKNGIERVEGDCSFLHRVRKISYKELENMKGKYGDAGAPCRHLGEGLCSFETPCRTDSNLLCPVTKEPCTERIEFVHNGNKNIFRNLLLKICREHLKAGHQVLVFVNDRMKVMQYCGFLYNRLKEYLPAAPPAEVCKKQLLAECGLEMDDVFGIMENDADMVDTSTYYQAFMSGIGFHSAALPNELRTYVEKKLLESRDMRIVCSTETLAFGVNSSVDVVIIADLYKHDGGGVRALSLNECQNYAGRAGRLRKDKDFSEIKGYVYKLINKKQLNHWIQMEKEGETPERLYSLFHFDEGQFMPFYLLNLMPTTSDSSVTIRELVNMVQILPQDGSVAQEVLVEKIQTAMKFLEEQSLIVRVREQTLGRGRSQLETKENRYCLTGLGKNLRGYIIGCDDYKALLTAIKEYVGSIFLEPEKTKFLFSLLCTHHAESGLNSIYHDSESRVNKNQVRAYIKQHLTDKNETQWLDACENTKGLFILAAMLAWGDGESAKYLYRQYGVHYALLSKLAEQVAYLIEIAKEVLPTQMEAIYWEKEDVYTKWHISYDDFLKAVDEKLGKINHLFVSVYYGINTEIIEELLAYLKAQTLTPQIEELLRELSLQHINPVSARKLRRIVIRYKFFKDPPKVDMENIELRNNYLDQLRQYKKDVKSWGPYISAFFREKFEASFTD